jgi:hypothetical protein
MKTKTGVITVVQEGRFRLVGDDGVAKQFVLSHSAPLEPQDLPPLQRGQARVAVRYDDSPHLVAGVAHDVEPIGPAPSSPSGAMR